MRLAAVLEHAALVMAGLVAGWVLGVLIWAVL